MPIASSISRSIVLGAAAATMTMQASSFGSGAEKQVSHSAAAAIVSAGGVLSEAALWLADAFAP